MEIWGSIGLASHGLSLTGAFRWLSVGLVASAAALGCTTRPPAPKRPTPIASALIAPREPTLSEPTPSSTAPILAAPPQREACISEDDGRGYAVWSPTGTALAVDCGHSVELIRFPTLTVIGRLEGFSLLAADGAPEPLVSQDGEEVLIRKWGSVGYWRWHVSTGELHLFGQGFPENTRSFSLAPDWTRLVAIDSKGTATIRPMDGASVMATLDGPVDSGASVSFNASGNLVAAIQEDSARVWDVASGRTRYAYHPVGSTHLVSYGRTPIWGPDGESLYFMRTHREIAEIVSWSQRTGALKTVRNNASDFGLSEDGTTLFVSTPRRISRVDRATNQAQVLYEESPSEDDRGGICYCSPRPNRDGSWLITTVSVMSGTFTALFNTRTGQLTSWSALRSTHQNQLP